MDWERVFDGQPDGVGFQEDPGWLVPHYRQFDEICVNCADLRVIDLSRPWHPLGTLLSELEFPRGSRRRMANLLLEGYRFAESGLGVLQLVHHDALPGAAKRFNEFPAHLRTEIFSIPIDGERVRVPVSLLRKAFRVAWQAANWDESVCTRRNWDSDAEEERWQRVADKSAPTRFKIAEQSFDFRDLARRADSDVRQALRRIENAQRIARLAACQQELQRRRAELTAIMKAVYGRHDG